MTYLPVDEYGRGGRGGTWRKAVTPGHDPHQRHGRQQRDRHHRAHRGDRRRSRKAHHMCSSTPTRCRPSAASAHRCESDEHRHAVHVRPQVPRAPRASARCTSASGVRLPALIMQGGAQERGQRGRHRKPGRHRGHGRSHRAASTAEHDRRRRRA